MVVASTFEAEADKGNGVVEEEKKEEKKVKLAC